MDLGGLTDDELLGKVQALAETERFSLVDLLAHLAELLDRDACQRRGYSSVFAYLTRRLGYAESDAIRRVRAARAVRRFPAVLGMLARGELHVIGLAMLEPHLDAANHLRLLAEARGRSQRDIEALAGRLKPASSGPRDTVRVLPSPAPPPEDGGSVIAQGTEALPGLEMTVPGPAPELAGETRRVFTFPAGEEVYERWLHARDLLRHSFPQGRMEEIFGEALRRLIDSEVPRAAKPDRPRGGSGAATSSRRIPLRVQDEVWRRDSGRCAYLGAGGVACGERAWLEFDHITPWSRGGRSDDPGNIRLLCRSHNGSEARRVLGGPRHP